ncbi:MAG: alpha-N-arabinofuranosidase [Bacteroidales bacterium]|nr:alpha-N-arabinofuranosidase [Bacteroidales bacterium]MBN2762051.1 alpha-N-arabinofuranosidase [Bacteroidales bacterium]
MKNCTLFVVVGLLFFSGYSTTFAQSGKSGEAKLIVNADLGKNTISRHIYGHFSEHLGHCIYGGYWVGEDSPIPNTRGVRNDVVAALKEIQIPNLRWPGGCFADEYHWMDGIGPRDKRPKMVNTHWGGVTEDNSFGTHEFMDLCEQLGTEPYICGNVGSGSVEEMSKWVEYLTFDGISPMAELRRKNGRDKAWKVQYWAVGNENWGCGGHMTPEFYADQYKRYATFCRNYEGNRLLKVAGGPNVDDYNWTETLMKKIPLWQMWGLSLHYYTTDWWNKGPATGFSEQQYFETLERCLNIPKVIDRHITIMDKYDPEKRVALVVDEWGTWFNVEPGTNPGFLFQQNTMRDAFVAGIHLNEFNKRCDRIKMANIAQTINVLQALIFTKEDKMVLTPTYHVFNLYKVHHDALLLPSDLTCDDYILDGENKLSALNGSASKDKNGVIHVSIVNIDTKNDMMLSVDLRGATVKSVSGKILTAPDIGTFNSFDDPDAVVTTDFNKAKITKEGISVKIPAKSIVVLELK